MSYIVKSDKRKQGLVEVLPKEDPLAQLKEGMKVSLEQTASLANVVKGSSRISITMIQNVFSDQIFNLAIDVAKEQLREEYLKELDAEMGLTGLPENSWEAVDRMAQLCRKVFPDRNIWDAMKFLFLRRIVTKDVRDDDANAYLNLKTTYRIRKLLHDLRKKMTPREVELFINEPGAMKIKNMINLFPNGVPESVWEKLTPYQKTKLRLVTDQVAYGEEKRGEITGNAEGVTEPSRADQSDDGGHGRGSPENSGGGPGGG